MLLSPDTSPTKRGDRQNHLQAETVSSGQGQGHTEGPWEGGVGLGAGQGRHFLIGETIPEQECDSEKLYEQTA